MGHVNFSQLQSPGGEGRKRFSLALSGGGIRAAAFQ